MINLFRKALILFALLSILILASDVFSQDNLVYRAFNPTTGTCSDAANIIIFQMNPSFTLGSYKCSGGVYVAFNFAASGSGLTGTGTAGTIPIWTGASALGDSFFQKVNNIGFSYREDDSTGFLATFDLTTMGANREYDLPPADGVLTVGTGTVNSVPKFTATNTFGNSLTSDDGSNVTVTGNPVIFTLSDATPTGDSRFGIKSGTDLYSRWLATRTGAPATVATEFGSFLPVADSTGLVYNQLFASNDGFTTTGISAVTYGSAHATLADRKQLVLSSPNVIVGAFAPTVTNDNASAFQISSTVGAFLPPRMSTVQRDLIGAGAGNGGLHIFNTTDSQTQFWNGSAWIAATTATPAGANTQIQFNNSGAFGADANFTFTISGARVGAQNFRAISTGQFDFGSGTSKITQNSNGVVAISNDVGVGGALRWIAVTPATFTANQNNLNPSVGYYQRWSSDATRNVTGVDMTTTSGLVFRPYNVGTNQIVLTHQDAASSSANRLINNTGSDIRLSPDEFADCIYDSTAQRHRCGKLETSFDAYVAANATNATTTMSNLTDLSRVVSAGFKYTFKLILYGANSVAADGWKIDFDGGTATSTNFRTHCTVFDTALLLSSQATALATDFAQATVTGDAMVECHGSFEPLAAGTFIPRFAENATTTGTLTVYRGSHLQIMRVP